MSNGASTPIDFSQTLAAFLASAVSDGTWDDVIEALKVDQSAAQATDITENAGQLWANVVDDMFKATWDKFFSSRKLWAFADATARDNSGSSVGVQVNDICNLNGTDELFYCATVAAGSSTWIAFAGGGTPPKTLQEVDWVPGAGSQTFAASVNDLVVISDFGGDSPGGRPLDISLPATANDGDTIAVKYLGAPDDQPINISAGGATLVDQPFPPGFAATVTAFDPAAVNWASFYAEWQYQALTPGNGWLLVSYWQDQPTGGGGEVNTSSNLGGGEDLAAPKVGADLPFKSLTAGPGVSLSSTANEVEISSPIAPLVIPSALSFPLLSTTFGVNAVANTLALANILSPAAAPGDPAIFGPVSFGVLASTLEPGADIVVRAPFPGSPSSSIVVTLAGKAPGPNPAFTLFNLTVTATYGQVGVIDSVAVFCRNPVSGRETFAGWISTVLGV